MENSSFENLVRIGVVSSVTDTTARVIYPHMDNMVSGDLLFLQRPVTIHEHGTHDWRPTVGQTVLCIYVPLDGADGFVLGGL